METTGAVTGFRGAEIGASSSSSSQAFFFAGAFDGLFTVGLSARALTSSEVVAVTLTV